MKGFPLSKGNSQALETQDELPPSGQVRMTRPGPKILSHQFYLSLWDPTSQICTSAHGEGSPGSNQNLCHADYLRGPVSGHVWINPLSPPNEVPGRRTHSCQPLLCIFLSCLVAHCQLPKSVVPPRVAMRTGGLWALQGYRLHLASDKLSGVRQTPEVRVS